MSTYRRDHTEGGTWFFTLATHERRPALIAENVRIALRNAIEDTRAMLPFEIDAWGLLPDHIHCIWTLPDNDSDFSTRWSRIKRLTTQAVRRDGAHGAPYGSRAKRREGSLWQRRFWEHRIRNDADFQRHMDYLHWNPVKHGLVDQVADWPWSSFHRLARAGFYAADWGSRDHQSTGGDFGE